MTDSKTLDQVFALIQSHIWKQTGEERVAFVHAAGRILAEPIAAKGFVPDFDRSSVDGYAVRAEDTAGCSDGAPVILKTTGRVLMGENAKGSVAAGTCIAVPTGGHIPEGADSVVMVEHTRNYGDGTVGILKAAAAGKNVIFRGSDAEPGKPVLPEGRILTAMDIGTLAALGVTAVGVRKKVRVGILVTGDELVEPYEMPKVGQVRNVHGYLLSEYVREAGGEPYVYGIIRDDIRKLKEAVMDAVCTCDMVVITGGTSVGVRDATAQIIAENGNILCHGIAVKPGKSTILGVVGNKPVWGLPGHPAAAAFMMRLCVIPMQDRLAGCTRPCRSATAILEEPVYPSLGWRQYVGVSLREADGKLYAKPIPGKAGLITTLSQSQGYFCIDRHSEAYPAGSTVTVWPFSVR